MLFGQDARSSKSNFIGCFDPNCHVFTVVEGTVHMFFLCISFVKINCMCVILEVNLQILFVHFSCSLIIFTDAINNAAYMCEQFYCASPSVEISEVNGKLSVLLPPRGPPFQALMSRIACKYCLTNTSYLTELFVIFLSLYI